MQREQAKRISIYVCTHRIVVSEKRIVSFRNKTRHPGQDITFHAKSWFLSRVCSLFVLYMTNFSFDNTSVESRRNQEKWSICILFWLMGFDSLMVSMLLDCVASVSKRVRRESWDRSKKEECEERFYNTAVLSTQLWNVTPSAPWVISMWCYVLL